MTDNCIWQESHLESIAKLFPNLSEAVRFSCSVHVGTRHCSGFLLRSGYVVTAAHVIQRDTDARFILTNVKGFFLFMVGLYQAMVAKSLTQTTGDNWSCCCHVARIVRSLHSALVATVRCAKDSLSVYNTLSAAVGLIDKSPKETVIAHDRPQELITRGNAMLRTVGIFVRRRREDRY